MSPTSLKSLSQSRLKDKPCFFRIWCQYFFTCRFQFKSIHCVGVFVVIMLKNSCLEATPFKRTRTLYMLIHFLCLSYGWFWACIFLAQYQLEVAAILSSVLLSERLQLQYITLKFMLCIVNILRTYRITCKDSIKYLGSNTGCLHSISPYLNAFKDIL